MNVFLFLLGLALLATVIVDTLWTILWTDGKAGPLNKRLTALIWWFFRVLVPSGRHRLLSLNGPTVIIVSLLSWAALLWFGWTFVFASSPDALLSTLTKTYPDFWARFYFVGYTIFTLGNGDFSPQGHGWQIATALATASGMMLVTLALSYLTSVISAIADKRMLASGISNLGDSSEAFVLTLWDGDGFAAAPTVLTPLTSSLGKVTEQHLAFPVLHYYHSSNPKTSTPATVKLFDEALLLLAHGVAESHRPPKAILTSAHNAVSSYLRIIQNFASEADAPPPTPDLERLREAGIPTVSPAEFEAAVQARRDRRRLLEGILEHERSPRPPLSAPEESSHQE